MAASGAWLELAVEADVEAVEAVSEILGRAAPGGTSVEPAFELVDEGLGARLDPSRPAIVRAYLPARDRAAAERAVAEVAEALGHLQAFGLRPIGELRDADRPGGRLGRRLEGVLPGHADRPAAGHPADLAAPPPRARRRRPRARPGDGVRDRPPPDDPAVPGRGRGAGRPRRRSRARACSTSAAARGSSRSPRSSSGAASALGRRHRSDRRSRRRLANARRNALVRRLRAREGSLPSGERAVRRRPRQPDRRRCWSRSPARLGDELRPGRRPARVGDLRRSGGRRPRGVRGRRSRGHGPHGGGRLGRARGHPAGAERPRPYNRRRCPRTSRSCSARTSSWRSASSCPRSCCRSPCGPGARRSSRRTASSGRCCGRRRTARSRSGSGSR